MPVIGAIAARGTASNLFLVLSAAATALVAAYSLNHTRLHHLARLITILRRGVKALKVQHNGQTPGRLTLSLGVAVFPDHDVTGEMVLRAADQAPYRAKQGGRDRVTIAESAQE